LCTYTASATSSQQSLKKSGHGNSRFVLKNKKLKALRTPALDRLNASLSALNSKFRVMSKGYTSLVLAALAAFQIPDAYKYSTH